MREYISLHHNAAERHVKLLQCCPVVYLLVSSAMSHLYGYCQEHKHFGLLCQVQPKTPRQEHLTVKLVVSLYHQQCANF